MNFDLNDPNGLQSAASYLGISHILKRFGTWAVTSYGVESLEMHYSIPFRRTSEQDWVEHMRQKTWVNVADFRNALAAGRVFESYQKQLQANGDSLSIFLCHAKEDRDSVRGIYGHLIAVGTEPWLDEEDLLPGQSWKHEISRQIPKSNLVLVFLSKQSVRKTGYVQNELRLALEAARNRPEGRIYVIPARLDDCETPDSLSEYQRVDLFREDGFDRLFKSLLATSKQLSSG